MANRWKIGATVALVVVLAIAAILLCGPKTSAPKSIRVGVLLSLTGDVGPYGQRSLKGLQLAADEINSAGGIDGKPIELVIEDARSSPRDAVSAFTKLVNLDGVQIVIGDVLSGTTLAVVPIAERNHVVLFAPGASNPALRNAGDYIFRNWVSDDFDGRVMAEYLAQKKTKNVFVLFQQTDYCVGLARAFENAFNASRGHIIGREAFTTETTDFRPLLLKLRQSNADDVYLIGEARQTATAIRQAKEMGLNPHWFSNLTIDTPEAANIAGGAREGVVFTTPAFDTDSAAPEIQQFVAAFKRRYGVAPEVTSGVAYDAMRILAEVLRRSGTTPDQVKAGLYAIRAFPGVTGATTFDSHGDVSKNIFVKVIKNDRAVRLTEFTP
jgi:branched-chain amino acid transport system substrate-binding protein